MANFASRAKSAFDMLFRPNAVRVNGYFKMLDGYTPAYTTFDGGVYEMELTRACIHSFASHASKLMPTVSGADRRDLQKVLDAKPNAFMVSSQFLYKTATLYESQNTCWIVPILDRFDNLCGYYPLDPTFVELVTVDGSSEPWLRYTFADGTKGAMELYRCGVISKFLYHNDLIGEDNRALNPTMQLMSLQSQGIAESIKSGGSFRFMATTSNFTKEKDLKSERKRFVEDNLGPDSGGLVLFPNTYTNIQQINSNPVAVDPDQMKIINTRVFDYFGTNEAILQNSAFGDAWGAYYEGKLEPFAIQLSQAMTCMTFSQNERSRGNEIVWSSNRLQYMSNKEKLETASQGFDRGFFTINMVMDIYNLPHVEDGDKRYIRKEYTEISQLDQVSQLQAELAAAQNTINAQQAKPAEPENTEEGEEE